MQGFSWAGLVWFHIKLLSNLIHLKYSFKFINRDFSKHATHPKRNFTIMIFTSDKDNRANPPAETHATSTILVNLQFWSGYFWACSTIKFTRTSCMWSLCVGFRYIQNLDDKQKLCIFRVLNKMLTLALQSQCSLLSDSSMILYQICWKLKNYLIFCIFF